MTKETRRWAYGYYCCVEGRHWIILDDAELYSSIGEFFIDSFIEIDPATLGMYIGRKDKNEKEIYGAIGEKGGDIVAGSYGIPPIQVRAAVEYDGSAFVIKTPKHHPKEVTLRTALDCLDIEVIGNQAQTPELTRD